MLCWGRRPTSLHDRGRDSDDDDFRDRDYDVAALANNLSQAFRYGIYSNDDIEEVCLTEHILFPSAYIVTISNSFLSRVLLNIDDTCWFCECRHKDHLNEMMR
jgi:hypothetical protein